MINDVAAAYFFAILGGLFLGFLVVMGYLHDKNTQIVDGKNAKVIRNYIKQKKESTLQCVYCFDLKPEFSCLCNAYYHLECWNELNRCATVGCPESAEKYKTDIDKIAYFSGRLNPDSFKNWVIAEKEVLYNLREYKNKYRKIL